MLIKYDKKFKRETNITTGDREKSINPRFPPKCKHKHLFDTASNTHTFTQCLFYKIV